MCGNNGIVNVVTRHCLFEVTMRIMSCRSTASTTAQWYGFDAQKWPRFKQIVIYLPYILHLIPFLTQLPCWWHPTWLGHSRDWGKNERRHPCLSHCKRDAATHTARQQIWICFTNLNLRNTTFLGWSILKAFFCEVIREVDEIRYGIRTVFLSKVLFPKCAS
jgi:hypothetical protein